MGVNSILVNRGNGFGSPGSAYGAGDEAAGRAALPKGQTLVENPSFHLTALYFMQEVRRQKLEQLTDELKEMEEEILADYSRGKFLVPFQDDNGVPLLKHPSGDTYQPIFTDPIEFGKFNREKKFKAAIVEATKIPDVLVKEAKGVVVNPTGVNPSASDQETRGSRTARVRQARKIRQSVRIRQTRRPRRAVRIRQTPRAQKA